MRKTQLTQQDFEKLANEIHNNFYNYSRSIYKERRGKIIITCPLHDDFLQKAEKHLSGGICPKCDIKNKTNDFIKRANLTHNNLYNYSKSNYVNTITKLIIICPKHGEFLQNPLKHLEGNGCPKCIGLYKTTKEFIEEVKIIHNDKYDYSKTNYITNKTKIIIICPTHGEFSQIPSDHLSGEGCGKCARNVKKSLQEFIDEANTVHNFFYSYDRFKYLNDRTKGIIICPDHGEFEQTPNSHLRGNGCIKCAGVNLKTIEDFIKEANIVHNSLYDYYKFNYIHAHFKGTIICKFHGEFEQTPRSHLNGNGCLKCCKIISKSETQWLDSLNIPEEQRQFKIKLNNKYITVDAFDPNTNTVYEFYGDYWHGNPKVFDLDKQNTSTKKTYRELWLNTMERERLIKEAGYNIISIWENDWKF